MDTILFIIQDTITANAVKVINSSQPCVQEAPTNCNDVLIVAIICIAIIIITWLGICKFFGFKKEERAARTSADNKKRENEVNDQKWKLQSNLIDKLLDFFKNKASEKDNNNGKEENANNYINALCTLISLVNKDTLGKEELDELKESCWLNKNKK